VLALRDGSRKLAACALVMLCIGVTGVAHAEVATSEPTPARLKVAAEAFDRGREAYKAGRYAEAAEQFERADANAPNATSLELAIKARDKAGDLERAGTLAVLALERHPGDENVSKVAPDIVNRARAELFELTVSCDDPCELADGGVVVHGAAATERTLFLAPGQHTIRAGWPGGRTASGSIEARVRENDELTFEAPEPAVEPERAEIPSPAADPGPTAANDAEKPAGWSPIVFWLSAGATLAAGGVTAWSGLDTVNNPGTERIKKECRAGDENCALYQDGRARQARTNVLIGVTGALAVATGLVGALAIDWGGGSPSDTARTRIRIRPYVSLGEDKSFGAKGTF
jgi:hypothetical protein